MTTAQEKKYWWEWGRVSAWYQEHGKTRPQANSKRHELHRAALGYDKSMKALTNAEFDKVLAKFRSVFDGGNLNAQLEPDEQPEKRKRLLQARAINLAREVWPLPHDPSAEITRERKLATIARSMCKCAFEACNDRQMAQVVGTLELQLKRQQERAADHIAEQHAAAERVDPEEYFG